MANVLANLAQSPARLTALVSMGLAVVGGAVVGGLLLATGSATEVNLTSAKLVPADAAVYVGMNTDLSSSQWVNAFSLAKRLGQEDPQQQLKDSVEDEGDLDWEDDIVPFLGGDAAAFFLPPPDGALSDIDEAKGGAIIRCGDCRKARDVLLREAKDQGAKLSSGEYSGVKYDVYDGEVDDLTHLAIIGDHLVFVSDEATLKAVIDTAQGREPALSSDAGFNRLRDDLTRDFIGFVYINPAKFVSSKLRDDHGLESVLKYWGAGDLLKKPMGGVVTAAKQGYRFQFAGDATGGSTAPGTQPRTPKLLRYLPADTVALYSTAGLAQGFTEEYRKQLEDALLRDQDVVDRDIDDLLEDAGRQIGIRSLQDLIDQFTGEVVVGGWGLDDEPQGALVAEVKNEAAMRKLVADIIAKDRIRTRKETVEGVEVTLAGNDGAYAFIDGLFVAGTPEGVRTVVKKPSRSVADTSAYQHTVEGLGTPLGSFVYVALRPLVDSFGDFFLPDSREFRALEGVMFNGVVDGGLFRWSGILSVRE
jgi:hypothetical protein